MPFCSTLPEAIRVGAGLKPAPTALSRELIVTEIRHHCDAVTAFQRLLSVHGSNQPLFFLDSALRLPGLSRYSFLGCQPFLVLKSKGRNVTVADDTGIKEMEGNPFEVLRHYLHAFR
ncbi:MAG TPA: hypothetical protein ACFYD3_03025, partial [Candidatus Hypogeohydataceae bacterium YC41]